VGHVYISILLHQNVILKMKLLKYMNEKQTNIEEYEIKSDCRLCKYNSSKIPGGSMTACWCASKPENMSMIIRHHQHGDVLVRNIIWTKKEPKCRYFQLMVG
jgi:hypothetical protein